MKIFVARLNFKTSVKTLRAEFEKYGEVTSAKIVTDRETNKSKGFGFIEMPNADQANAAIAALHDKDFDGRRIIAQEARENR